MLVAFLAGCGARENERETDYAQCLACHEGIERISGSHELGCVACHLMPLDRPDSDTVRNAPKNPLKSHDKIIRNPSHPAYWEVFCLPCHEQDIHNLANSLHGSMAGVINQTRYLWGAQETAAPAAHGLSGPFKPLPEPDPNIYPDSSERLVDDFLRRRCLRCHIHTKGAQGRGLYRAAGCAACHVIYGNDGRYRGKDQAIDVSREGYPMRHVLTKRIPNDQCLRCHNQNRVGADYEGLFEHDFSRTYRSPRIEGGPSAKIYGLDHHHLARDIHAERGLWCIDCHLKGDIMGDGTAPSYAGEVPMRTCSDCHGGFDHPMPDSSYDDIKKGEGKFLFVSKVRNAVCELSLFSDESPGHNIPAHAKVRCSACHAQWTYDDYGLSVVREDVLEGGKWYYLTEQGDPSLEAVLQRHLDNGEPTYPSSKDWLTGQAKPGIWSVGWRFRRWEFLTLGMDGKGRFAALRPHYQYFITYVDRLGNVPLDSTIPSRGDHSGRGWAFMPYVPHTVAPFGRSCDSCHLNRAAAGLGIGEEMTADISLTKPSPPAVKGMRLLNRAERQVLLKPSMEWKKARLRTMQ